MKGFPGKEIVERLRQQYPEGTHLHERSIHEAEVWRPWNSLYGGQRRHDIRGLGLWFRPWYCLWRGSHPQNWRIAHEAFYYIGRSAQHCIIMVCSPRARFS